MHFKSGLGGFLNGLAPSAEVLLMRNALTLVVIILAMALLFAALANPGAAAAQTGDTPTPVPTNAPDDDSRVQDLPPSKASSIRPDIPTWTQTSTTS